MADRTIQIYGRRTCPYCRNADAFAQRVVPDGWKVEFHNVDLETPPPVTKDFTTIPKIFINGKFIGGYSNLQEHYNRKGKN